MLLEAFLAASTTSLCNTSLLSHIFNALMTLVAIRTSRPLFYVFCLSISMPKFSRINTSLLQRIQQPSSTPSKHQTYVEGNVEYHGTNRQAGPRGKQPWCHSQMHSVSSISKWRPWQVPLHTFNHMHQFIEFTEEGTHEHSAHSHWWDWALWRTRKSIETTQHPHSLTKSWNNRYLGPTRTLPRDINKKPVYLKAES